MFVAVTPNFVESIFDLRLLLPHRLANWFGEIVGPVCSVHVVVGTLLLPGFWSFQFVVRFWGRRLHDDML
jgi:hypothetical protein